MLTEREINYSQVLHIHYFIIFIINSVVFLLILFDSWTKESVNKRPELVYFKLRTIQLFLHWYFWHIFCINCVFWLWFYTEEESEVLRRLVVGGGWGRCVVNWLRPAVACRRFVRWGQRRGLGEENTYCEKTGRLVTIETRRTWIERICQLLTSVDDSIELQRHADAV